MIGKKFEVNDVVDGCVAIANALDRQTAAIKAQSEALVKALRRVADAVERAAVAETVTRDIEQCR